MRSASIRTFVVSLTASLALLPACRTIQKAEGAAADVVLPVSEEKKLGVQLAKDIEAKSKLSTDPEVIAYVNRIGQRVASTSPNPDRWRFNFKVIDDPETVSAFAIPGGNIYVYTGLLLAARDEAEVAGVMAHEVAHVTSRHIARRMVEAYGLQTVAGLALGQNPGQLSQIAAAIVVNGTLLKNSRDDESEADEKGIIAASRAQYDPKGMVDFFQTLKSQEGQTPGVLAFLSDHPTTSDRITAMNKEIAQRNLTGSERNPAALQAIQARIKGGTAR